MRVNFFYRNYKCGYSIQKVFATIEEDLANYALIKSYFVPSPKSMPWDIIINGWFVFRHRNKRIINHVTGHIHDTLLALIGCKTVLTIHDLVFLDNVKNPVKRFYKWLFWLYLPIKLATKVTCISTHTKKNILKYIKTDKLIVIHNPVDKKYRYVSSKFNTEYPTILHIGTGWNKNLERTIQALQNIPCHLRIVGKLNERYIQLLQQNGIDYSNAFDLSDDEIHEEYIKCDIVNFPSLYEGFGMPIIEGQATGRVVITSQIEPLIEVSQNSVHYVDAEDISSLKEAYIRIIEDNSYRSMLIKSGLENVKRFCGQSIAKQYMKIYEEVLHS